MTTAPGTPQVVETAAALLIGAELLSGKVRDENLTPLSRALRSLGIRLQRVVVVPDDRAVIGREIADLAETHDVVFTSGGVGPTHDDVTIESIALAQRVPVVEDPELVALLARVYGEQMTEAHRLMARVPRGARLVTADDVRWPTVVSGKVWIFPGVPQLFRMKLALIRQHLRGPNELYSDEVLSSDDEVSLKTTLDAIVAAHPDVEVGSYPRWFDPHYKTKITFDGTDRTAVNAAAADLRRRLGARVVEPRADAREE